MGAAAGEGGVAGAAGRGTLAARAYDLLDECGHPLAADVLVAHCFGVAPKRNPEFWRGQLARVLADDATFVQDASGSWGLRGWQRAEATLDAIEYVVIDVETTGLGARTHRLLEVAAVRCRGTRVLATFASLVNPHKRLSAFIQSFTGITPDMVADAPEVADVLPCLLDFLGADPLVGHNVAFDLGFLHAELARLDGGITLTNTSLDTGRLAARLLPHLGKPSLDRMCAALDLAVGRRHRAAADALLTARAFWELGERARAQGIVTFAGLQSLAAPARAATTSMAAALRGERRTGRTLLDPALRQNVPQLPGVYLMKDAAGEVIYVGKAKRLRDRISSYYAHPLGYTRKMDGLLESVCALETIVVGSELEALLLESRLIKHYLPRFNVQQRYYAHYPFIKVDVAGAYPRVAACRDIVADGARYFGPFRSMRAVRLTIDVVHRLFPVRTCTRTLSVPASSPPRRRKKEDTAPDDALPERGARHRRGGSPCLRYQLGRCLGPCHGNVSPEAYRAVVEQVLSFLGGGRDHMLDYLRADMHRAAERWDFERAAHLRDLLKEARKVLVAQHMLDEAIEQRNLLIVAPSAEAGAVEILGIRHGRLHAQRRLLVGAPDGDGWPLARSAPDAAMAGASPSGVALAGTPLPDAATSRRVTFGGAARSAAESSDVTKTAEEELAAFVANLRATAAPPPVIGQEEVDQITIIARWIAHHYDDRTFIPLAPEGGPDDVARVLHSARALLRRVAAGMAEDGDWEAEPG
jgi:DNA polymerase-3 subunit epsilon